MHAPVRSTAHHARDPLEWAAPLFGRLLDRIDRGLTCGGIRATLPGGRTRNLGLRAPGPVAVVHVRRWRALWRLASGGSAGWYEGWADGDWDSPDPVPLFDLFMRNAVSLGSAARAGGASRLFRRWNHWRRRNDRSGSRRNIAAHYDLGNSFYSEWLSADMTYSSAMFASEGEDLAQAQERKLASVLARTGTNPGDAILEIGCGWGSFAELAARQGRQVHGITLSTEQLGWAETRTAELPDARFSLLDYRDVTGCYDAVASIEMVEAVGQEYWPSYLDAIARALKPGGRAALQYIAIDDRLFDAYAGNVDFIQSYVFPGGLLLSESRFRRLAEQRGLQWTDRRSFGLDYAETLRRWRLAYDRAVAEDRLPARFDRKFHDLWRYYLMYCEGGFLGGGIDVAQVTLVKR